MDGDPSAEREARSCHSNNLFVSKFKVQHGSPRSHLFALGHARAEATWVRPPLKSSSCRQGSVRSVLRHLQCRTLWNAASPTAAHSSTLGEEKRERERRAGEAQTVDRAGRNDKRTLACGGSRTDSLTFNSATHHFLFLPGAGLLAPIFKLGAEREREGCSQQSAQIPHSQRLLLAADVRFSSVQIGQPKRRPNSYSYLHIPSIDAREVNIQHRRAG